MRSFFVPATVLALSASLLGCDAGLPASMRGACLAEDAAGATRLLDGYPVGMLDKAYHGSAGRVSVHGDILRVLIKDRLTNKRMNFALEFTPGTVNERSDQCGPKSLIVRRISVDGEAAEGLNMQDVLEAMVQNTALAVGFPRPNLTEDPRPNYPGAPPVGAHVPPTPVPADSFSPQANLGSNAPAAQAPAISYNANAPGGHLGSSPAAVPQGTRNVAYSAAYRACMASGDASAGVTLGVLNCAADETARQDVRLNQAYRAAMARLTPGAGLNLRISERAWVLSRDAGCKAAVGDEAGGTLGSVIYAQCVLKQEAMRAQYLEGLR